MRRHVPVLAGGSIAICLAVSLLVAGTASALSTGNGGWQWQNPLPQGNPYSGGYFLDASHGWLISGGVIFHTSNGGARLTVEARHNVTFKAITFVGSRHGWAVGYPAAKGGTVIVYRTTNGGRSWTRVRVARVGGINDVSFATTKLGWATAGDAVLQTADGGLRWTVHTMRAHDTMYGVQALTARRVYAAAGGALLRSVDGGATWQRLTIGALKRVGPVSFANLRNGWIGGNRGIVHTTDGGAHWTLQLAAGPTVTSLDTTGSQNGWATIGGGVYRTTDGGAQWLPQATAPFAAWVTATGPASATIGTGSVYPEPFAGGLDRTTDGGATWQPSGTAADNYQGDLAALQFVNATTGWAAGGGGEILATTNGGATWTAQSSNTTEDLNGVHFADAADGWAVGDQGTIVHTSDGGATWTAQTSGTSYQLTGVTFSDAQNGWATGQSYTEDDYSSGLILHTSDGGQHWTTQYASTFDENTMTVGIAFSAVAFADAQHGWAVGETQGSDKGYNSFVIMHTSDGGATWTQQLDYNSNAGGNEDDATLTSVACTSAENAVAVGSDDNGAAIWHTANGGQTWTRVGQKLWPAYNFVDLADVTFATATRGWAVGGDTVIETTDGGKTWTKQNVGSHASLNAISFVSATHGWVAGQSGSILTTATGGGRP